MSDTTRLDTYLFFNGDCEAAFKFYEKVLGAKIDAMLTHEGTPAEKDVPPEWRKKILHAHLTVGDAVLMASDAPPGRYQPPQGFSVSLQVDDPKQAERIFHALAESGTVTASMEPTFFALRFGMVTDRFSIPWMVMCPQPEQQK